ncbi:MAG: hypothetical protein ACI4JK_05365 [Oscillospiraceae bacterium]
MIDKIIAVLMLTVICGFIAYLCMALILVAIDDRKPKRPKNIQAYAGCYLRGDCPRCGYAVSDCDGRRKGGISYCPACGKKIKFPRLTPEIDGVKSLTADEYEKMDKQYRKHMEYYMKDQL